MSTTEAGSVPKDTSADPKPNVPFFKKRNQGRNVRKRNLSDDDDDHGKGSRTNNGAESSTGLDHSTLSSVSKKRSGKRAPQTSHSDLLLSSSNSDANRSAAFKDDSDEKSIGVSYKATLEGNIRIDDATRTQEIDTAHDRDAQAIIDRHLRNVENGGEEEGLYKGMAGYKSFIQKSETTNSKIRVGPMRASANIRVTNRFDYQPDICKDYKETGFCGYGDSCIYMHDRGDYKAGWQLDQEWEEEQRKKKLALIAGVDEEEESLSDEDDVPFACILCREEFKIPVVTKCGHYFCEKCALKRYAKSPKCAACQTPTAGIFNAAPKDFMKRVEERKAKMEESNRRREADDAAAAAANADGNDHTEDTGMVEDLSVVGMGGAPSLSRRTGDSDDSDDSDDDDDDRA